MGGGITSLNLLRDAHKKLNLADLDISTIPLDQFREAQRLREHDSCSWERACQGGVRLHETPPRVSLRAEVTHALSVPS